MTNFPPIACVVLAAGKGTRMKSALPKVLHPIAGLPMLAYPLMTSATLHPSRMAVVVAPDMDMVAYAARQFCPAAQVVIQAEQKGTGHAVQQALPVLEGFSGIVLVLYGDTPFISEATLRRLVTQLHDNPQAALAFLAFEAADPGKYGRVVLAAPGLAEAIVEYKDATEAQRAISLCNSGVMAVRAETLAAFLAQLSNQNASGEFYLTDLVAIARKAGHQCAVTLCPEQEVLGVNSQSERAAAEALMQNRLRQRAMDNGVLMIAPETVFLQSDTQFGSNVTLHPYITFGANVQVADGAEIKSFCHIEQAIIGQNAVVGPYARLRPGAVLEAESHIGNFVEVKNSRIGAGAKANHLTYIGDAEIGAESNIGAGTITCNYDGYQKHRTVIGSHVFVGSNTSLVAPVSVGDYAVIGAGSTIVKDVPADAIARNDMPQRHAEEKAKEYRQKRSKKP